MNIPLVDIAAQHAEIADAVRAGWEKVVASTAFIGGPAVAEFEEAYAAALGVAHCVGLGNGTDALELALRAVGVGARSEVILPANTFVATAEAVVRIGAKPVLVDVDPVNLLIDPAAVAAAITSRTKAIIPVHLYGQTAPVEQLVPLAEACGAVIVEDAAQAQGARRFGRSAGTLGALAATSFYPGKNLGAAGDAGAVTTDSPELAHKVRLLGAHGSREKYVHEMIGFNSRLDTLQAVVLLAKLPHLARWNALRRAAANRYLGLLANLPGVVLPTTADGNDDVWHLYVVRVPQRDRVLATLKRAGIAAGIHYPHPIHLTLAFAGLRRGPGSYPEAERASRDILSLPLYPQISVEAQEYVAATLRRAVEEVVSDEERGAFVIGAMSASEERVANAR
jgi:dTDP-4-amino-4,6-dideoxygalactose transaminase